jgi:parvulin-like peptidyl-prolyl isomerase
MRVTTSLLPAIIAGLLIAPCSAQSKKAPAKAPPARVLVVVDGENITETDLVRMFQTRQVPADTRDEYRRLFLEELIDARLIQRFLAAKKVAAGKAEIDRAVQPILDLAAKGGADPEKAMAEKGYTTQSLRDEIALGLSWKRYVDGAITPAQMRKYFEANRSQFDGTEIRARQIYLKVPAKDEAGFEAAEKELSAIRQRIVDGKLSFEEAARSHSQSPSRELGGDVGFFRYSGQMPSSFSQEAFRLQIGEVGQPFRSTFGVHLCLVTERKPGSLSLEDVREEEVLPRMSQELWKQTVAEMRKTAKVDWKIKP